MGILNTKGWQDRLDENRLDEIMATLAGSGATAAMLGKVLEQLQMAAASGRTLGRLSGIVQAHEPHGKFSRDPVHFVDQLQVSPTRGPATCQRRPFQIPGDAGAVLLDRQGRVLGLLHGAGAQGMGAIATPIDRVLQALDVRFDPAH